MALSIYNTLTKKKEEFSPLAKGKVNMYTCGVTVYDDCHIGHARSLYIFDVMRRYLEYKKYKVNFVRNITDIDDKIINRANELKVNWSELAEKYINSYNKDLESLGVRRGILDKEGQEPRATKNIPEMIKHISGLIDKGYAYVTKSGVYFSVRKFKDYGKLSHQTIDQMLTGVRKEPDETKNDPLDFALWKLSKPDEPKWPSPWGEGRPGWHIECSVMSQKFLKTKTLDIHAGGIDLVFPHHENEIAQAEALTGKPFAKYWIHHGLLTINGQKMAKSLGNFITIKNFIKEEGDFVLKLFFLSAHYRSPLDYNEETLHMAEENVSSLGIFFNKIQYYKDENKDSKAAAEFKEEFIKAMDDDFNMPVALSTLLEMSSFGHKNIDQNKVDIALSISKTLEELLNIFNLGDIKKTYQSIKFTEETVDKLYALQDEYRDVATSYNMDKDLVVLGNRFDEITIQKKLRDFFTKLRNSAKQKKDFPLADKIRNELNKLGIILEDTKDGKTTWRIKI